ncbi:hypothetical protein BBJ28_00012916 [Nothophytophthora sp. Chile5]|nr:hypothetical protein BBJ28_00012916 [Nothophytophthora sp. Chile5]
MEPSDCQAQELEARRDGEAFRTSYNPEDNLQSAQEQLAELQLLTRAELHGPAVVFASPSREMPLSSSADDELDTARVIEAPGRHGAPTGPLSSFTAILTASRRMESMQLNSTQPKRAVHAAVMPLDQTHGLSNGDKGLSTLNEGDEGEEEEVDEETPETPAVPTSATQSDASSYMRVRNEDVRQERDQDDSEDREFHEMLRQLSRGDTGVLVLVPADLTVLKLERVRAALDTPPHPTIAPSSTRMSDVRTLVAIDMLRLLMQRLGSHAVREAVTLAIKRSTTPDEDATGSTAARRSILAKDGTHVLMQEKIAAFDHRGQSHAMPAFRVRVDSADAAESAAKRRQRGLQYADDHSSHRTIV